MTDNCKSKGCGIESRKAFKALIQYNSEAKEVVVIYCKPGCDVPIINCYWILVKKIKWHELMKVVVAR